MAFYDIPLSPIREDGSDREAPSAIVNAAGGLSRWMLALGMVTLTFVITAPWFLLSAVEMIRTYREAIGQPGGWFADAQRNRILCVVCAGLAVVNALCMIRACNAIREFAASRLVSDLHLGMRRLRTVWCVLGMTLALVIGGALAALFAGELKPLW